MFDCEICGKSFDSALKLGGHKSSHSRVGQKRVQKSRTLKFEFACNFCGKTTETHASKFGKFCSSKCSGDFKSAETMKQKRILWEADKLSDRQAVRKILTEDRGYECTECGISEWNGKPITLWVDHIDGNAGNCARSNYRLVCPNCDSQSVTFGAKNYGKGRKSRGMAQYG